MRGKIKSIIMVIAMCFGMLPGVNTYASGCPALRIIFLRGSGESLNEDQNYISFKNTIESKLKTVHLDYEFMDLDYKAVGVGDIGVMLGAAISAGESYEFGDSVKDGVSKLINVVNNTCPGTKYVLGGYSQGAMVISRALPNLKADKIIYAATFGDPKIYLPEGAGILPPACRGDNLSDYRMYVPDCQAYIGLLGANKPYEPSEFLGKLGTWCNKGDIMCSSKFNISDHVSYVSDGLYEDASKVIFYKITQEFGLENKISSPHDTAILIDSTGSMINMIDKYKAEALRLAKETLDSGGRVALYDYRDLSDPYQPKEHCNFNTCTLEIFKQELDAISVDGGGDTPESLLSASLHMMKNLTWKHGATKSVVILTDADFVNPDRDGVTLADVVRLSKSIDPVNFYIIVDPTNEPAYTELASLTDGKVVTNFDELSLLTDYIMERFDSLPRVEEEQGSIKPKLKVLEAEELDGSSIRIKYETESEKVLVIVNDTILGATTEHEITISELTAESIILLVPIDNSVRGDAAEIRFDGAKMIIPLAPDTGIPK